MQVNVLFFAVLREKAHASSLQLDVAPGTSVAGLLERLRQERIGLTTWLDKCAVAVNRQYVPRTIGLKDGDEVALIPPVSGG